MKCFNCGNSIPDDSDFCISCGMKQPVNNYQPIQNDDFEATQVVNRGDVGQQQVDYSQNVYYGGGQIYQQPEPIPHDYSTTQQPQQPQQPDHQFYGYQQPIYQPEPPAMQNAVYVQQHTEPEQVPKKNHTGTIVAVVMIVIALILGGVLAYVLLKDKADSDKNGKDDETTTQEEATTEKDETTTGEETTTQEETTTEKETTTKKEPDTTTYEPITQYTGGSYLDIFDKYGFSGEPYDFDGLNTASYILEDDPYYYGYGGEFALEDVGVGYDNSGLVCQIAYGAYMDLSEEYRDVYSSMSQDELDEIFEINETNQNPDVYATVYYSGGCICYYIVFYGLDDPATFNDINYDYGLFDASDYVYINYLDSELISEGYVKY